MTDAPTDETEQTGAARGARRPILPLLVLLAIIGGLAMLVVARQSPGEQLRRLIDRQIKLANGGRFGELHATLSARAKVACPRSDFVGALQQLEVTEPNFWFLVNYRDIGIHVTGGRAEVTYVITYNGRVVEEATPQNPDVYSRATQTVLGPKPNLEQALANLARAAAPGPNQVLTEKEYKAQKARLLKFGTKRPVLYRAGQWYDDVDGHLHCGT